MRRVIVPLLLLNPLLACGANVDGQIDLSYGENEGRTTIGYLESATPDLRAVARSAASGKTWLFADNAEDAAAVYVSRLLPDGIPDPGFGPNADGRRRIVLPA